MVENYPLIQLGMTQAEVELLLGGPPGNYGVYANGFKSREEVAPPSGSVLRVGNDDRNMFELYFDFSDRLVLNHKRGRYEGGWPYADGWFTRQWRTIRWRLGI